MPQDGMPKRDMPHDCMPNYWTARKSAMDFLKKRQVAITTITEIQIFSKALWASWIGR